MVPLNLVPIYAPGSYPNKFYFTERNTTEWSVFMKELVLSGNKLSRLLLQDAIPELPDAHIGSPARDDTVSFGLTHISPGIFDSHSLFQDIYDHPASYLNGTAPLNVTGVVAPCVYQLNDGSSGVCSSVQGSDKDSFLWYVHLALSGTFLWHIGTTNFIPASKRTG